MNSALRLCPHPSHLRPAPVSRRLVIDLTPPERRPDTRMLAGGRGYFVRCNIQIFCLDARNRHIQATEMRLCFV